jgi:hypothetical protein
MTFYDPEVFFAMQSIVTLQNYIRRKHTVFNVGPNCPPLQGSMHSYYSVIMVSILQLIMTGVAVLVVDRLGRRPLLIGGVSGIVSLSQVSSYLGLVRFPGNRSLE